MGRIAATIRRVASLTRDERSVATAAFVGAPAMMLALRVFGFRRVRTWAVREAAASRVERADLVRWAAVAKRAAAAAPLRSTCLSRSLVLQWWLARRGVDSRLRIGARVARGALDAHAWLEVDEFPITDSPEAIRGYSPLETAATRPANA